MHILQLTQANTLQIAKLMDNGVSLGELVDMIMTDKESKIQRYFIYVDKKWMFVEESKLKDLLAGAMSFVG